ncbi:Aste57867_24257 [Aphanomyces stellatus]|uniref:Aste57867_24257 protein n=1 Tax=Aphanomyces stellatus TaxID=120398 RepID=A0A485LRR3_9STRA|nr:hypothetical protein As57867_024182 [Aphanomyces stellatus]VFU00897.1 Aste57867_24257 [Aphanomyces stellatus]
MTGEEVAATSSMSAASAGVRLEDILPPTQWASKKERPACSDCGLKFNNLFRRRHHCRLCGELFCKQCVVHTELHVPGDEKTYVKICLACSVGDTDMAGTSYSSSASDKSPANPSSNKTSSPWTAFFAKEKPAAIAALSKSLPGTGTTTRHSSYLSSRASPQHAKSPVNPLRTNEKDRLVVLREYSINYTMPDAALTAICADAAAYLRCSMGFLGFMEQDTNWIKAAVGLAVTSLPRSHSMCADVVASQSPLVVLDTEHDLRFHRSPLVTDFGVRFYAAVPLLNKNGWAVGTLVAMDREPRKTCSVQALVAYAERAMMHVRQTTASPVMAGGRRRRRDQEASHTRSHSAGAMSLDADFALHKVTLPTPTSPPTQVEKLEPSDLNEAMLLELLTQSSRTQSSLAEQNGALVSTLGDHSEKIELLTKAISRMETKLMESTAA